jgi:WD40 repeat protein
MVRKELNCNSATSLAVGALPGGVTMRIILAVLILLLGFGPDATRAQDAEGQNWQLLRTLMGHTSLVHSVAFFPDGRRALSGSGANGDGLRLWDLATGQTLKTFTGKNLNLTSAAYSPDGTRALSGDAFQGVVRLWDLATGQTLKTFNVASVMSVPPWPSAAVTKFAACSCQEAQAWRCGNRRRPSACRRCSRRASISGAVKVHCGPVECAVSLGTVRA